MAETTHNLIPLAGNRAIYDRYPHEGDCTDTLCTACGCCTHCADDGHREGRPGCSAQGCGCEFAS